MVVVNPIAVMQTRRYRVARRHVYVEISVIGAESPVDVTVRIVDDERTVLAKASPHVRCDVAPTTVCAGLMDAINRHSGSKTKTALLNDDGVLTDLLTQPDPDAEQDDPDPDRVDKADDEVDWDAVRDRLVECLPGYVDYLVAQAKALRDQQDEVTKELQARKAELGEQAKELEDQVKAIKHAAPKESKAPATKMSKPISAPSDAQTIPPSIPPEHSRHGRQK